MHILSLLELFTYFIIFPIVYKVVIAIDITKIFRKEHVTEIRMFYFFVILIMTKILGDFIILIMNYIRQFLGITI